MLLLIPGIRLPAAAAASPVVVTTVSGERFIGAPVAEDADAVRLVSDTLGEIRIPRAAIRTLTRGVDETSAEPRPVPAVADRPAAPKAGLLQSRLHLPGKFNATVGAGVMAQSGILEQRMWSGSLEVGWEVGANVFQSSVAVHRQSTHGIVIDDAERWNAQLQHNVTPRFFLFTAAFHRKDTIMAVERETILFAGPGYKILKTPSLEATTAAGPAYIWQQYLPPHRGVPAPDELSDPAAVLYQSLTYAVQPRIKLNGSVVLVQSIHDHDKQLAHLILSLDYSFSDLLALSNSYQWQRDSRPRVGSAKHQGLLNVQLKLRL